MIEWRTEGFKGWAITYPIVTENGAKFTPIDRDWWMENAPALLP